MWDSPVKGLSERGIDPKKACPGSNPGAPFFIYPKNRDTRSEGMEKL